MVHFENSEKESSIYETQGRTLIAFLAGTVIGSLVTYFAVKNHFRDLTNKEIDEMSKRFAEADSSPEEHNEDPSTVFMDNTRKHISNLDDYPREDVSDDEKPRILHDLEDYTDDDEYDKCTLIYYSDGILADQYDHQLSIEETIGDEEFLDHFGEVEKDILYVRNEHLKTDYEIIKELFPAPDTVMMEGDIDDD